MHTLGFKPQLTNYTSYSSAENGLKGRKGIKETIVYAHSLDFIVSGKSLRKRLANHIFGAKDFDVLGTLGRYVGSSYESRLINEYLGLVKPELYDKRTCFYTCVCGGIDCGGFTGTVEVLEQTVVWKNFYYERGFYDINEPEDPNGLAFTFDRAQYFNAFQQLRKQLWLK